MSTVRGSKGLSHLLLRYGVVHFAAVMVLDILSWSTFVVESFDNVSSMANTLTSILVSRFILDLRDDSTLSEVAASLSIHLLDTTTVQLSTPNPRSSRLIGNLGGTLRLGDDDEEQEEEEGECGDGYGHEYGPADDCET
ncbi:hypothetical protein BDY19DRAFT_1060857, partial [Irpex rosettiformis]